MVVVHAGAAEVGRSWGRHAHLLEEAVTGGGEGDNEALHICDMSLIGYNWIHLQNNYKYCIKIKYMQTITV
jgi:hypothetical protein